MLLRLSTGISFALLLMSTGCGLNKDTPINNGGGGIIVTAPVLPPPPGNPWTPTSSIVVPPNPAPADGTTTATIQFQIRDYYLNPVPGIAIVFSASGTGTTITQPASPTNSAGVAFATIKSSTIETKTITVLPPNLVAGLTGTADFVDYSPNAATSTITGTTSITADGVSNSQVSITIRNPIGIPLSGFTPTFTATDTGGSNNYGICSATNAAGLSNCTLNSTFAETKTLTITSPVTKSDGSVAFVAGPAVAGNSSFIPSPSTGITPHCPA